MKKLTQKYKKYLLHKSKTKNHNRDRGFRKLRHQNANTLLRDLAERKNKARSQYLNPKKKVIYKSAPSIFSIKEDPQSVIAFIYELKSYVSVSHLIKRVVISFDDIDSIDIGAICMLLSVIEEFSLKGISFKGNIANNHKCLPIIQKSGFLQHMTEITGTANMDLETDNIILKRGRYKLDSKRTGVIIRKAMLKLTGEKNHYQPVYNMIGEIALNSFEHAYIGEKEKHWFFSVFYEDDEDKIIFVFADNGQGILNTLESTFSKSFFEGLKLTKRTDILKNAFQRKYGSRFEEQPNKGKGLPSIRIKQVDGHINNLLVITNNVLINFENNQDQLLRKPFGGTFYYWELEKKCVDLYTNGRKIDL